MGKDRDIRRALKNVRKVYLCEICKNYHEDKGKAVKCARKH